MVVIWMIAVIFVIVLILFLKYTPAPGNELEIHELVFSNFPASLHHVHLFFICDIHQRMISEELVQRVKGKVDFVIIGGNIAERGVPFSSVSRNVALLRDIAPVYFVWGSSDYKVDHHELDALLLDHKVKILDNTRVLFESEDGEQLLLIGVDDVELKRDRLDLALADCEEEGFRILVSHSPDIVHTFTENERISLVLSSRNSGRKWQKKRAVQRYEHTTLFVSNGYGAKRLPFRFRAPAQAHLITLRTDQSSDII